MGGWGEALAALATLIGNELLMRHVNKIASLEKDLLRMEARDINDQDDVRIVEIQKEIIVERDALIAQTKLMGK